MHSQEPWQSRSPTGSVNKPLTSTTLEKTGRRGLNHSYGRGLPVKRKALVILTVAILAFAMIPALGTSAATGDIKIVTPNEIVDPTNSREDLVFDRLQTAEYVSTATGGESMEDTYGTLYVVIDDNDSDANALTAYTATFSATTTGDKLLTAAAEIHRGSHPRGIPATSTQLTTDQRANLNIGDFTRDGNLNGDDIRVYIDYGSPAQVGERVQTIDAVIATGATVEIASIYGTPDALRIVFYSASTNTLQDDDGDSRVEVRTTTDTINVLASEKNLQAYEGTDNDGLTAQEFASTTGAVSRDSGIFVAAFGLIDTEWKEMLDDWVDLDGGMDATRNMADVQKTALLCTDATGLIGPGPDGDIDTTGDNTDTADGTCDDSVPDDVNDPATIGIQATFDTAKVADEAAQRGTDTNRDVVITVPNASLALAADQYIADSNEDGVVDHRDIEVRFNNQAGPGISVKSFRFAATADGPSLTNNLAAANLYVTVTLPSLTQTETTAAEGDVTTIPGNKRLNTADSILVTYDTTANLEDLIGDIEATDDDGEHTGVFDELDPASDNRESKNFVAALNAQSRNLGAPSDATNGTVANSGSISASVLINRLLGVTHGGDVAVRYNDESAGIQTMRTKVDTVAPTVKAVDPTDKSFTTDDRIDGLFSVTDEDAGIPEDAEDPGRNDVNLFSAGVRYVTASATINGNAAEEEDFDPDSVREEDEIEDGYTYEYRIDIPSNVVRSAQQNNQEVEAKLTVVAYDQAGNRASKTFTFTVDLIDPELLGALTGWGAESNSRVARSSSANGAFVLTQNAKDQIVLIFNGPIDGANVDPADIAVDGVKGNVTSALWLAGSADNVISTTGLIPEDQTGDPLPGQIHPGANATDDVEDDGGSGMALLANQTGQDARHLLFLTLSEDLPTDAKPVIAIDRNDVQDLAGNELGKDHSTVTEDRLNPTFTVTPAKQVTNGDLAVTIESSEPLTRRGPTATLELGRMIALTETIASETSWTVSGNLSNLRLSSKGADDGVWTVKVVGTDEAGNEATSTKAKWELDTTANNSVLPKRSAREEDDGTKEQAAIALSLETNEVVFLNLDFGAEGDEYGTGDPDADPSTYKSTDTKDEISIDSLSLEALAASAISGSPAKIATNPTVESTTDVDAASAQTSDGVQHVVALTDLAIGNYRLNVGFSDEVGNTGKFGFVFKIIAPKPAEVTVVPGWSLVSIPGTPQDSSIGGVLGGSTVTDVWSLNNETKVWEFARVDAETGEWMGTLSQIVDGRAYFVRSSTFDPIEVLIERFNPQRTPSQYTVTSGWNGIGYTPAGREDSISVDAYLSSLGASGWGMIRTWDADATPPQYETYFSSGTGTDGFPGLGEDEDGVAIVEKGKGYLLFATRNGVIGG